MKLLFFLTSLILTTVFGGSWIEQVTEERYFFLGVGTNSRNAYYATAGENGVGTIFLLSTDNGLNWTTVAKDFELLSLGCGSISEDDAVITGLLGKAEYTLWGGYAWKESIGFVPVCQSVVHSRAGDIYGAAGGEGIAISTDKGVSFTHHKANGLNATRYGAVPSSTTWFVTAGLWAEEDDNNNNILKEKHFPNLKDNNNININKYKINQRLTLFHEQNSNQFAWDIKYLKDSKLSNKRRLQDDEAIWGEIWRTTDAGENWQRVYRNEGNFYFNAIDCCDVNTCYAVAEGDSDAGSTSPGSRILVTKDGGTTWDIVYWNTLDGSSLMAVHCLSDNEAWAAGGDLVSAFNFHGFFYHTLNGGANWTSLEMTAPVLFMDMSNDGQGGIATGLNLESQGVAYGYMP